MSYRDEIKKIEYYKQKIINRYLEDNQLINNSRLQQYLDSIDMKLAIFRQAYIQNGEEMDVEKFNSQKADIYQDLKILYEIIYELAKERYVKVETKIRCALEDLNQRAKYYSNRTKVESLSVYGNTLYYETNGFSQYYNSGKVYIDLGPLSIPSGSYVVCILDSNEVEPSNTIFRFNENTQIADYMYNRGYLRIPGNYKINTYNYETEEAPTESFEITAENLTPDNSKSYNIFAGADKIKITDTSTGGYKYIDKVTNIAYTADKVCDISFYIYNASYINFTIVGNYDYKSFEGYQISSPKQRQKILIKARPGFNIDFVTDGQIYADKGTSFIEDKKLYSNNVFNGINDYMVEEIEFGEPITFDNVQVIIDNAATTFYDINSVTIKQAQISELDGEYEL